MIIFRSFDNTSIGLDIYFNIVEINNILKTFLAFYEFACKILMVVQSIISFPLILTMMNNDISVQSETLFFGSFEDWLLTMNMATYY